MPRTSFSVFLSSTSKDLAPHRSKVREMVERLGQGHDEVGLASISMETFGARPTTPLNTCRERAQAADALVVIVGHRYGWVPTVDEGGNGVTSITWLEVTWAIDAGKPVYAFLVDPTAPGEKESDRLNTAVSTDQAGEVFRAVQGLKEFRSFLESRQTRELFTSADDLGGKVATSLAPLLRTWISSGAMSDGAAGGRVSRPATPPAPRWIGSPFPGLRAFTPLDSPIFFGRDRETDHLIEKLSASRCRFLLVTGTSGSGKSSLVAAGLLPRLAANGIPGSEHWLVPDVVPSANGRMWRGLRFTPGEQGPDPFVALASKLAPMLPGDRQVRDVGEQLRGDPSSLPRLVDNALAGRPATAQVLMFVDQFEELVTVVQDGDLRARFVALLDAASRSNRFRIIGTVRADFSHRCIEEAAALAEILRDRGVPGGIVVVETQGPVEVKPFRMAKYPVTYRQYKAFLDHPKGYHSPELWKGLKSQATRGEQYRRVGNHPAENVSWYDAVAFCRWLSNATGFDMRLPSEGEWQQAATSGNPGNMYPWGPEWEDRRANTSESRLSRTTAVGMYPHGATSSPPGSASEGVLDLSGNVWEWCQDKYKPEGREREASRVLRGGSWLYGLAVARAAWRHSDKPGARLLHFGFRVVCVSPI